MAPVTIEFKILFQKLCQTKLGWDNPLPEELLKEWKDLVADLPEGRPISLPRSYLHSIEELPTSITLCGFCDASTQAYAAVVYLVVRSDTRTVVRFVVAKTRVAPLQSQTIPRLELLSAFLLAKLIVSVTGSLRPSFSRLRIQCYTDSQVALYWIRGANKEWKPFVQNRVNEIRRNVHPDLWSHCPGISNPADLPSRGLTALDVSVNQLWRRGPEWLNKDSVALHTKFETDDMPEECSYELKAAIMKSINLVTTDSRSAIDDLMTCQNYSNLSRLLRVTAQVVRAVRRFKRVKSRNVDAPTTITSEELEEAEKLWITSAQKQPIGGKDFTNQRKRFGLFKDNKGLWRCGGRLTNVDVPYSVKHPILLYTQSSSTHYTDCARSSWACLP